MDKSTPELRQCECGTWFSRPGRRWPQRCEACRRHRNEARWAAYKKATGGRAQRDYMARKRAADPEAARARHRADYQRYRAKVFDHYGWHCVCCGSTENLTVDHVNADGSRHRRELFGADRHGFCFQFCLWLIRNNFPSQFQTLCGACNLSKGRTSHCWILHEGPAGFKLCRDPGHIGPNPLPFEEFSRSSRGYQGLQSRCKICLRRQRNTR